MFRRVRDFARRHRGKLIVAGVVGGVAYVATRYVGRKLREWQEATAASFLERTKKQLHFETTQRTCVEAAAPFTASILAKADGRFDPEAIIAEIRAAGAASAAEKMPLWDRLKSCSICRAFSKIYGAAMLSVLIRVQLNVVGGYMYVRSANNNNVAADLPGADFREEDKEEYLAALKRFVDEGFTAFCDELERIVAECVASLSLKDKLAFDRVSALAYDVKNEVDGLLQTRLVDFLYPAASSSSSGLSATSDASSTTADVRQRRGAALSLIAQETRDVLEMPDVFSLVRHLSQLGANDLLDALAREWIARSNNRPEAGATPTPLTLPQQHSPAATAAGAERVGGGDNGGGGGGDDDKISPGHQNNDRTEPSALTAEPEASSGAVAADPAPQPPLFHQFTMPFAKLLPLFAGFSPDAVIKDMSRSEQLKNFSANVYETFSVPSVKI